MSGVTILAALILGQAATEPKSDERCGSYCLYVGLKALDVPVGSLSELEDKLGSPVPGGYSLGQLAEAAESYGLQTLGVQTSTENLRLRERPFICIAHVDDQHFVLLADMDDRHAWVLDPPAQYTLPLDTLRTRWDGNALLIARNPLLREEDLPRPFPWAPVLIFAGAALILALGWLFVRRRRTT